MNLVGLLRLYQLFQAPFLSLFTAMYFHIDMLVSSQYFPYEIYRDWLTFSFQGARNLLEVACLLYCNYLERRTHRKVEYVNLFGRKSWEALQRFSLIRPQKTATEGGTHEVRLRK